MLLARWITEQQFRQPALPGYGGVKIHPAVAAVGANGTQYYRVSPYSANLAVLGLLRTRAVGCQTTARLWIGWYLAHLNATNAPDGVPCEHFYERDGTGETTCVKPTDPRLCRFNDATDSAAATFFSVLWAAHEAGVTKAELNTLGCRERITPLADALLKLQQADGLCWAKLDYRAKYLEDNCEVFAGLHDLAKLEEVVFDDPAKAHIYAEAAGRVRAGILKELYDPKSKLYSIARFEDNSRPPTNLNQWYPDTQAQLWPHLFGVVDPKDARTQAVVSLLNQHWNGQGKPDWATHPELINHGSMETGAAYGFLLAGETNRIRRYTSAVIQYEFPHARQSAAFAWPFNVAEAGWLLQILDRPGVR